MTEEQKLIEKLRLIESLFAGATTEGERDAAANARDRIRQRLEHTERTDPPIEYKFTMSNMWSRRLLVALLRRYGIRPFRYYRQRYTTVMAMVPERFVDETLWPEFKKLDETLVSYIDDITARVISETVYADSSEAEVVPETNKELPEP